MASKDVAFARALVKIAASQKTAFWVAYSTATGPSLPVDKRTQEAMLEENSNAGLLRHLGSGLGLGGLAGGMAGHMKATQRSFLKNLPYSKKPSLIGGAAGALLGAGLGYLHNKKTDKKIKTSPFIRKTVTGTHGDAAISKLLGEYIKHIDSRQDNSKPVYVKGFHPADR